MGIFLFIIAVYFIFVKKQIARLEDKEYIHS